MAYKFQAKIASCGCHVYKNFISDNVKASGMVETDNETIKTDPYCCAVEAMVCNTT